MAGKSLEDRLVERFMRYSAISSQSNPANVGKCLPTSPGQQELAELLAAELRASGLEDVVCDDHATVTAVKRGRRKDCPTIGFIVHLDTVDVGLSPVVKAQKLRYEGGDICLNKEQDIWLRVAEHPEIERYVGENILFSDGTSVLGADDKAAVTTVMEMITSLQPDEEHGDIIVCCVPDEEVGLLGAKNLDIKSRFNVDFAYTLDCCELGEVLYENFNAAKTTITFTGVTAHPMTAKGVLVNPLLMAVDFISRFDRKETPECTEGKEGYQWLAEMTATQNEAVLHAMIREFDLNKFKERKQKMIEVANEIQQLHPTGRVQVHTEDVYRNISDFLGEDRTALDIIFEALSILGVEPKVIAMRGGTDGAVLSSKGIVTPNYFTGAHNFHSKFEFLPLSSLAKSYELTRQIVFLAAKRVKPRL
ncbi:peptidase T, putative [Trypanosoma cruzi]|uniref:Peptidase T, putative n=1 Tax=Trypanosoma cruzi (strain CL Brener) TaxID=353153 RepID=Q4DPI6_TRYCC|nr:peptidase T, putative [Trypanosoma cruzi]EAN94441.1 peptidase T, putative [Trypanosoma cruzi]|eukprot:XP_816292.1 peptidase T [Trypanosoma cruzi strain CL Brener]